ncbi:hypothetical protein MPH_08990 [Macrophomina phaseolina MS6]|uniref:Uncharacterized protein n=1 Tax=Macrophomina phaseolina (strain MS6) TaxID=1126212 RepID=K2RGY9_MACPH|nr:hypothetical protein MPH_08990 [Macrophomina phaseolina MS6]
MPTKNDQRRLVGHHHSQDSRTGANNHRLSTVAILRDPMWEATRLARLPLELREMVYDLCIPDSYPVFRAAEVLPWNGVKLEVINFILRSRKGTVSVKIYDTKIKVEGETFFLHELRPGSLVYPVLSKARSLSIAITTNCSHAAGDSNSPVFSIMARIFILVEAMRGGEQEGKRATISLRIHTGHPNSDQTSDPTYLKECAKVLLRPFTTLTIQIDVLRAIGCHTRSTGSSSHNLFQDAESTYGAMSLREAVQRPNSHQAAASCARFVQVFKVFEVIQLQWALGSQQAKAELEDAGLAMQEICRMWVETLFTM